MRDDLDKIRNHILEGQWIPDLDFELELLNEIDRLEKECAKLSRENSRLEDGEPLWETYGMK